MRLLCLNVFLHTLKSYKTSYDVISYNFFSSRIKHMSNTEYYRMPTQFLHWRWCGCYPYNPLTYIVSFRNYNIKCHKPRSTPIPQILYICGIGICFFTKVKCFYANITSYKQHPEDRSHYWGCRRLNVSSRMKFYLMLYLKYYQTNIKYNFVS